MADVIAKMYLVLYNHQLLSVCYGRCCCQVADGIATVDWNLADVIAMLHME